MKHKYIVMQHLGDEAIFVFPCEVSHDRIFEACEGIRFDVEGTRRDWVRKYHQGQAISAGFITDGVCHGRSETMNLESRGAVDTALFKRDTDRPCAA